MTVSVIDALPEHAAIISAFNQQMAVETEDKPLNSTIIDQGVLTMLNTSELGYYLVAAQNDQIAGCLGVTYEWSDWRNGLWWWIQSVYVHPSHRGSGVFSAMYEEVKRRAQNEDDVIGIRLYVEKDNERAQRTYQKLGMIETDYRLMEEEF